MLKEGVSNFQVRQWMDGFVDLKEAMVRCGFKDEDMRALFRTLAVIILLCDLEFAVVEQCVTHEIVYVKDERKLAKSKLKY